MTQPVSVKRLDPRAKLPAYGSADAAGRNELLKSVLATVWYQKNKKTHSGDFQLTYRLQAL